jgi:hypothetical protein
VSLAAWQAVNKTAQDNVEGFSTYAELTPRWDERLARVPSFKAEFIRTPNYVYGVPEGAPVGTVPNVFPDPLIMLRVLLLAAQCMSSTAGSLQMASFSLLNLHLWGYDKKIKDRILLFASEFPHIDRRSAIPESLSVTRDSVPS